MLQSLWQAMLDFLFPPRCAGCRCFVERPGQWCPQCLEKTLRLRRLPLSPAMARLVPGGAWAVGLYEGSLRRLIRRLKFQRDRSALSAIQTLLAAAAEQLPQAVTEATLAIPVPLHAERRRQRGFNQAELIFREGLEARGLLWADILCRSRPTQPQYGLDARQRRENVRGAFSLQPGTELRDQQLLLVDDILTTGATLEACARVLHKAGAASITILVLASGRQ